MRVSHSIPSAGIGLALLATFGFAGQSRQKQMEQKAAEARSSERFFVDPIPASWTELLEIQAALPPMAAAIPEGTPLAIDPPASELSLDGVPFTGVRAPSQPSSEGVEPLVLCPSLGAEPALDFGFAAQADIPDGGGFSYIPPSVSGDVGPNHLMTMMNNKVHIQDRVGGTVSSLDLLTFWSPLGATLTTWARVSYDALSGRWIATVRSGSGGAMSVLFAISDTDDPTGTWDFYAIVADGAGTRFPDWLPHGINSTWVTIMANMLNVAGGALAGVKMWVIDMSTALAGGPITVSEFPIGFLSTVTVGAIGNSFTPTTSLDTSDPDMWLVNTTFGATGTPSPRCVQLVRLSGTGPAPVASALLGSPFGGSTSLCFVTTNFSTTQPAGVGGVGVAQVGDPRFIGPFSFRVQTAVVRNSKIWLAHQGGLPLAPAVQNRVASFWHQIDPTLPFPASAGAAGSMLVQDNVIDAGVANSGVMMPSIAVNCGDDALIGFSRFDATRNPESGYVVHLGSDPLSAQGPLRLLKAGDSSYWKNFGAGTTAQWGNYSSAGIDPVDDKTFWTLQEYAAQRVGPLDNDSRWGTWWGRVGSCGSPTVFDDPDPVTACFGNTVSFSVGATAFVAPLAYQWRKNTVAIPGATSSTYSIASTVTGDGATYDVVVSDGCGSSTSLGALLDFAGVVINTQPVNQHVPKGGTATFSVSATGTGALSYLWRKDGVALAPAETNSTLTVTNVQKNDIGFYDVIVTDVCDPVLSTSAVLSIPPTIKSWLQDSVVLSIFQQPQGGILCEGTSHTLQVQAYGENLSYVWRKGGFPIVPPETNDTLVLNPVVPGDAGSYDCVVSDDSGSLTTNPAVFDVEDVPTIMTHPTSVIVSLGDPVSFSVTATGDGSLSYQWKKGGLQGPLFDISGSTEPTHEISSADKSHIGAYQCAVSNFCGAVLSDTATLTIVL